MIVDYGGGKGSGAGGEDRGVRAEMARLTEGRALVMGDERLVVGSLVR